MLSLGIVAFGAFIILSCAMLWFVGEGMSWSRRLTVAAITLASIICVVAFERSGLWQ